MPGKPYFSLGHNGPYSATVFLAIIKTTSWAKVINTWTRNTREEPAFHTHRCACPPLLYMNSVWLELPLCLISSLLLFLQSFLSAFKHVIVVAGCCGNGLADFIVDRWVVNCWPGSRLLACWPGAYSKQMVELSPASLKAVSDSHSTDSCRTWILEPN